MKKILMMLALFPFLHATSYEATLVSCKQDEIIVHTQGQDLSVSLFNVKIKETAGWNQTCSLLEKADKITMEVDPSSAITTPLPVYLFADTTLLQEALVKDSKAFIQIRNPEYTYEQRLEDAENTTQVVAQEKETTKQTSYAKNAPLFLFGSMLIWLWFLYRILRKKKRENR